MDSEEPNNHHDKTSSKYIEKETKHVYHAKQVFRIKEDGYIEFGDGQPEMCLQDDKGCFIEGILGHQRLYMGDWLLTDGFGYRKVVQAASFNKEYKPHFEEGYIE